MWEYNYDYLEHHGILGQKWGVRRFQNKDGSLTAAGKKHYSDLAERAGETKEKTKSIAAASGVATAAIAGFDVAAIMAGASSIMLPLGPAAAFVGAGAAYVAASLANNRANKILNNHSK